MPEVPAQPAPPEGLRSTGRFPEPGCDLGRFRDLQVVGVGGMGAVFRAWDPVLAREVAVKVCDRVLAKERSFRERFRREIRTLAALQLPGVVAVYEAEEADGWLFFTMPFIQGQTLRELLDADCLTLVQRLELGAWLARTVATLHQRGIWHRDLKPANVILQADGEPCLVDFGLSRRFGAVESSLTLTGQFVGTMCYMAPEMPDLPADDLNWQHAEVYTLGVVVYELLSGRMPYPLGENETFMAISEKVRTSRPRPLASFCPELPRRTVRAVMQTLAKDPRRRPLAAALAAELAAAQARLAGSPALPAGTWRRWLDRLFFRS